MGFSLSCALSGDGRNIESGLLLTIFDSPILLMKHIVFVEIRIGYSRYEGHTVDALVSVADEGRGKLR